MSQITKSTCCYCGVGCGVLIEHDGTKVLNVSGDPDHPANLGRLCSKGSTLHLTGDSSARALYPELRLGKTLARSRTDWDTALDHASEQFAQVIAEHGPDSVAFYLSGQLLTEDYFAFNKLVRGLVGTNNVDSNSRLCMSSAVVGYKKALGADAPPCSYEDIEQSDCVLIIGSNMAFAHPVLFRRLEAAKAARPDMQLIVVDPRRTDTAELADIFLPIQPGTDVALCHGLLHILLWEGWIDRAFIETHTEGFDALKTLVRDYTPELVAEICGIKASDLHNVARLIGSTPSFLSLWCMGLNQSSCGTDKVGALINLHLATGQIGKPGSGPFSLTGQPNAMGGRETGTMASILPGHRDPKNAEHRAEVARFWGVDSLPENPGLTAIDLFQAIKDGKIKALWIACTNPAQSLPNQTLIHEALAACPFVVVQEAFTTSETVPYADLLLPAASWSEKEGSVTNSERRISHVRAAVPAPGEARPDWAIAVDFAKRLEQRLRANQPSLFPFQHAEEIFLEHAALTAGRDLDLSGLNYTVLDSQGPQQWPFPQGAAQGTARLYQDRQFATDNGKAKFMASAYEPTVERRDARYELSLMTGRLRDQWHGMTRTGTCARLFSHTEEAVLSLNPRELSRRNLSDGQLVSVKSRRGSLILPVKADDSLQMAQAFLPMHWGGRYLKALGINTLTLGDYDPYSQQPELKHSAITVKPVELPWTLYALVEGDVQNRLTRLRELADGCDYVSLSLVGRDTPAVVMRAAHTSAPDKATLAAIDEVLGLDEGPVMAYDDPRQSVGKRVKLEDGRITALRLAGESAAREWLKALYLEGETDDSLRRWLLAPLSAPPGGNKVASKVVCNCVNVNEDAIKAAIGAGADLDGLKQNLGCGTQCGSCVPELKRLINQGQASQLATAL
ncbi:assimilatory nitrate reductase catalytic subunit [Atopomonas hussainii]|uniref:Assimilatory nitrate reductase catalytic subunit n=1 Tax=Atopomonas hussainii TaxID=1429083 RepID=A0A1H7RFT2_9GAMM|nr:nitrate reductase [Atopomonas hussainii]SEL58227.1 assimilatory nitrate reductase catalytic subunit [Atopomonas hussainii]